MDTESVHAVASLTVAQALHAVRRRDLGCEGIPMILALHGAAPAGDDDSRREQGERLARRLGAIHAEVARLDGQPMAGADRDAAVAGEEAVKEAAPAQGAPEGSGQDELLEDEAARAVSAAERILAEAVTVLAHAELSDPRIELQLGSTQTSDSGPLVRMQRALAEGRFITVVNYHNTPAGSAGVTRDELTRWGKTFSPVGVQELQRLFATGTWDAPRPPLIPVFYEGYRNNVEVAAPACEQAGLTGWFFLITGFLDADPEEQEAYARAHDIALASEDLSGDAPLAMTWDQAADVARAHVVTAHTATHCPAHHVGTPDAVDAEIVAPARAIRRALGAAPVAHAWLFGSDLAHDPRHVADLHRAGYQWLFSNTGIDDIGAWTRGAVRQVAHRDGSWP